MTKTVYTLRDAITNDDRIEYAMTCPEVGIIGHGKNQRFYAYVDGQYCEKRTRYELATVLVRAWDQGLETGARSCIR